MTLTSSDDSDHPNQAVVASSRATVGVTNPHNSIRLAARLYESPAQNRRDIGGSVVVLAIASLVDVALAKNAFDVALRLPQEVSWFVAVGVGLIAVTGAFVAGILAKRRSLLMAAMTATSTALIGAALYLLRAGTATGEAAPVFESSSAPLTGATDETLLAPVMLLIFCATTALAFADGWRLSDPDRARFWALTEHLEEIASSHARKDGRVTRLHEETTSQLAVLHRLDTDRATALASLEALADELREWARIEIARELGDPRSTSAIH